MLVGEEESMDHRDCAHDDEWKQVLSHGRRYLWRSIHITVQGRRGPRGEGWG